MYEILELRGNSAVSVSVEALRSAIETLGNAMNDLCK